MATSTKPPHIREITPRSVIVGLLVALVIGASYPYVVLKFGFGPNISVVSAFFGSSSGFASAGGVVLR